MLRYLSLFLFLVMISCKESPKKMMSQPKEPLPENISEILDSLWNSEQIPIRKRDSLMRIYGVESEQAAVYQAEYKENHAKNILAIQEILDRYGWPDVAVIGPMGSRTICNILQHASQEVREVYLPMMEQAVLERKLAAAYLARASDRLATDRGELQIYGGQMKFYPETKTFNIWPVFDPKNINKRRAAIGLNSIEEHLIERFDFVWDLEEQLKRTAAFEKAMQDKRLE